MGIYVVRAFVQMRETLASHTELGHRLDAVEAGIEKKLAIQDDAIANMIAALRELMTAPTPKRRSVGFTADLDDV